MKKIDAVVVGATTTVAWGMVIWTGLQVAAGASLRGLLGRYGTPKMRENQRARLAHLKLLIGPRMSLDDMRKMATGDYDETNRIASMDRQVPRYLSSAMLESINGIASRGD